MHRRSKRQASARPRRSALRRHIRATCRCTPFAPIAGARPKRCSGQRMTDFSDRAPVTFQDPLPPVRRRGGDRRRRHRHFDGVVSPPGRIVGAGLRQRPRGGRTIEPQLGLDSPTRPRCRGSADRDGQREPLGIHLARDRRRHRLHALRHPLYRAHRARARPTRALAADRRTTSARHAHAHRRRSGRAGERQTRPMGRRHVHRQRQPRRTVQSGSDARARIAGARRRDSRELRGARARRNGRPRCRRRHRARPRAGERGRLRGGRMVDAFSRQSRRRDCRN